MTKYRGTHKRLTWWQRVAIALVAVLIGSSGTAWALTTGEPAQCTGDVPTVDENGLTHLGVDCTFAAPVVTVTVPGPTVTVPVPGPTVYVTLSPSTTTTTVTVTPSPTTPAPTTTAPTTTPPPTTAPPAAGWPGAGNTGVPDGVALVPYTGPCTITAANAIIVGRLVNCDLTIRAAGVGITNSRVNGIVKVDPDYPAASLVMTDSEVIASTPSKRRQATGVEEHDFTLLRVEITGGNRGAYCAQRCTIKDSWVHGQLLDQEWHASAVRMEQNTTLIHNTLVCDAPDGGGEQSCSASLTGYGDYAPIRDNLIQGNHFLSTPYLGYCAYGGSSKGKPYSGQAANIVFRDNVFDRGPSGHCGWYSAVGDWDGSRPGNVWSNNRYDNGVLFTP